MALGVASEIKKQGELELHRLQLEQKSKETLSSPFYNLKSVLGYNWATFYILLGGAQAGKSYSAMDFCLSQKLKDKENNKFYWFRLTDAQSKKLLANNAMDFVDPDLLRKYKLQLKTNGSTVYSVKYKQKVVNKRNGTKEIREIEDKDHTFELARILDLSTFYKNKGVGYFDKDYTGWYNIVIDEFQPEKGERNTFPIVHAFVRSLENIVRNSKTKVRVIMMANLLEEASDILACFNFIPEAFGRYTLVKNKKTLIQFIKEYNEAKATGNQELIQQVDEKYYGIDFGVRAVIDYLEPTDKYKKMRNGSIADRLLKDNSEYSNVIKIDKSLIYKGKLHKPTNIIKFGKDPSDWFTIWDSKVIKRYNKESKPTIPMTAYLDDVFNPKMRDNIILIFDNRGFLYKDLVTFKFFQSKLMAIRPSK